MPLLPTFPKGQKSADEACSGICSLTTSVSARWLCCDGAQSRSRKPGTRRTFCWRIIACILLLTGVQPSRGVVTPITVDFSQSGEIPLLKKYGVYNSGIIPLARYTKDVLASMGLVRAASLRIDLSIGKYQTGFTDLMSGEFSAHQHAFNFNFDLIDTLASGLQAQKVMPYWGLTYNPIPFQPVCKGGYGSKSCAGSQATCSGFEDQAAVPGTNNYSCTPHGASAVDDCWKCPPRKGDDDSYSEWGQMVAYFHQHFLQRNITPLYEEHWNEPDLTEYYNPTLAAFKGSSQDYVDAYTSCAVEMLKDDPDLLFGGISAANQMTHNPAYPKQPNNEDTLLAAAENGLPMDFLSFHSITTQPGMDQVKLMVDQAQSARDILSSSQLTNVTGPLNRFNSTEVHCNEFFPNSTVETLTTAFSGSPYLATLLLETWTTLLEETDLTMVHWAQYMDIFNTSDQIGLIDWWGNPRPAWWAFRWYAELPTERVLLEMNSPHVRGLAGYSARSCSAGVLLWNIPTPRDGNQEETTVTLALKNVPFSKFNVEAYIIDERKQPAGFSYSPSVMYQNQSADVNGDYIFPSAAFTGVLLPVNGTIYVKLVPLSKCAGSGNFANALPAAQLLRPHYYFGFRPRKTSAYAHFHVRDWSAYLGMGGEAEGSMITGATVRANRSQAFNISMNIFDGQIATGGIAGIRMDFSAELQGEVEFQQPASYFFYQKGTSPCVEGIAASGSLPPPPPPALDLSAGAPEAPSEELQEQTGGKSNSSGALFANQNSLTAGVAGRKLLQSQPLAACGIDENHYVQIPLIYGTEKNVWANNFIPVDLADFAVWPSKLAPAGWDGRIMLLFVLKDGTPGTKVQAYVTEQPGS